ncbi:MAG TPA: hypothetical protein DIW23_13655 [Anaerolineae bacterium]|nr:hypothetical protein [Anaerolineae bacterium]
MKSKKWIDPLSEDAISYAAFAWGSGIAGARIIIADAIKEEILSNPIPLEEFKEYVDSFLKEEPKQTKIAREIKVNSKGKLEIPDPQLDMLYRVWDAHNDSVLDQKQNEKLHSSNEYTSLIWLVIVSIGIIALLYFIAVTFTKNPDLLGGLACILVSLFLLYQTYITGKIRLTFRASLYIWLLLIAGIVFTFENIKVFFTTIPRPTTTLVEPTMARIPTLSSDVITKTPSCFYWSQITPNMAGQIHCVYGTVINHTEDWENELTRFYFGTIEEFFIVSNYRWETPFEGECIQVKGEILLNTYDIPYIKIEDRIDYCN